MCSKRLKVPLKAFSAIIHTQKLKALKHPIDGAFQIKPLLTVLSGLKYKAGLNRFDLFMEIDSLSYQGFSGFQVLIKVNYQKSE